MKVSAELQAILKQSGLCVSEACDRCGRFFGAVRFTHFGDPGVWCSRECRDGAHAHAPGTCRTCNASLAGLRRGTKFCSDTCRKRENRKSQTTQISRDAALKTDELQGRLAISTHSDVLGSTEAF
jgi:hypothetical protein